MHPRLFAFVLLAVVLPAFVPAQVAEELPPLLPGDFTLTLRLVDAYSGEGLSGQTIQVSLTTGGRSLRSLLFTDNAGLVRIPVERGPVRVLIDLDKRNTPGADWAGVFSNANLTTDVSATAYLEPVATLLGEVLANNRTVGSAQLSLDCPGSFYPAEELNGALSVRSTGVFTIPYVPARPCRAVVSAEGNSGTLDFTLSSGELSRVSIELSRQGVAPSQIPWWLVALVLLGVAGVVGYYLTRYRALHLKEQPLSHFPQAAKAAVRSVGKAHVVEGRTQPSTELKAVLSTLSERERSIVEFALQHKGHTTQAAIYRALLLPKATLSRLLRGLEQKHVFVLTPHGKVREVKLSPRFRPPK